MFTTPVMCTPVQSEMYSLIKPLPQFLVIIDYQEPTRQRRPFGL
jgi:hypothetical protein